MRGSKMYPDNAFTHNFTRENAECLFVSGNTLVVISHLMVYFAF